MLGQNRFAYTKVIPNEISLYMRKSWPLLILTIEKKKKKRKRKKNGDFVLKDLKSKLYRLRHIYMCEPYLDSLVHVNGRTMLNKSLFPVPAE